MQIVQPPKSALSKSKRQTPPDLCNQEIFPECLQDFYHIPAEPATNPGNSLGVTGYLNEFATQDDLNVGHICYKRRLQGTNDCPDLLPGVPT